MLLVFRNTTNVRNYYIAIILLVLSHLIRFAALFQCLAELVPVHIALVEQGQEHEFNGSPFEVITNAHSLTSFFHLIILSYYFAVNTICRKILLTK